MPFFPTQATILPASATLPPQTQFTRERQVRFLEALSITGNVRAACRSACIAPQTAYRLRRPFRNSLLPGAKIS